MALARRSPTAARADELLVASPHSRPAAEVLGGLRSDAARGLGAREARARLERVGRNELDAVPPTPSWKRFLAQFQDVLVLLLLGATAISAAMWVIERETAVPYETLAILAVVIFNATLGWLQESRAEAAVAQLRRLSADDAEVLRDGERRRVPASELVPGDVILLDEGDTVPADARLLESAALHAAEAALTGESLPVAKDPEPVDEQAALGDRTDMAFSGTTVTHGHGLAVVTATGMRTEMGRIANLLERTRDEATPLQRELAAMGKLLGLVVVVLAAAMIGTILVAEDVRGLSEHVEVLILGVALAVAAVPEGLPAVVTAVLSLGVQRLARRNAIVRHLAAVETLGSANVIASDKTGTLTRNEMTVRRVVTASGRVVFGGTGYAPEGEVVREDGAPLEGRLQVEIERALTAGDRANNASVIERGGAWIIQGDPTEAALLVAARKAGLERGRMAERLPRIGEVPFSSQRKLMSTVHRDVEDGAAGELVFTKGAPDVLLARCTHELVGDSMRPIDERRRAEILAENDALAAEALRTLAIAVRRLPDHERTDGRASRFAGEHVSRLEHDLAFAGLVGMIDPPRAGAAQSVARARSAGIRVLMITGDHPRTASVIARELGIEHPERLVTGPELAELDPPTLREVVARTSVYARVDPAHKLDIVGALQQGGATVAMTGDGVNDAPALKAADIGVAMGIAGTDVSKEASDIVLADDDFATIVAAVEEGRAVYANIRKFLRFLLSSNGGEVLTMFAGVLLADELGLPRSESGVALPLLATQVLWINLVTDGAPAFALGVDPPDSDLMLAAPRPSRERAITPGMWRNIALIGVVMATGTLLVLDAALSGGWIEGTGTLARAQTMAFTTLMLFQLFNVLNSRSEERSAFAAPFSNPWLWLAILVSLGLQVAVLHVPGLQRAFGTEPLSAADWLVCTAVASSVLWVREATKLAGRALRG